MKLIIFTVSSILLMLFITSCNKEKPTPNISQYYTPKVLAMKEFLSIQIPVEIGEKNGKKSFVDLFELYGFSGNGPSIEQVVKKNINLKNVQFDSEGDVCIILVKKDNDFDNILQEVKCIEDINCLVKWLNKSFNMIYKE